MLRFGNSWGPLPCRISGRSPCLNDCWSARLTSAASATTEPARRQVDAKHEIGEADLLRRRWISSAAAAGSAGSMASESAAQRIRSVRGLHNGATCRHNRTGARLNVRMARKSRATRGLRPRLTRIVRSDRICDSAPSPGLGPVRHHTGVCRVGPSRIRSPYGLTHLGSARRWDTAVPIRELVLNSCLPVPGPSRRTVSSR